MAKYWRMKVQPFGGDLKGVFLSLHTTKSDISIFYRDEQGRPNHRFPDVYADASAGVLAVYERYAKPDDILLPAQGSQKPGNVLFSKTEALLREGRSQKTWSAWHAWLRRFEVWKFEGDPRKPNPRKQYACEVSPDGRAVIEMKECAW